jgi:hypothetical protein
MQRVKGIENLNLDRFWAQGIVGAGVIIHTYTAWYRQAVLVSTERAGLPVVRSTSST